MSKKKEVAGARAKSPKRPMDKEAIAQAMAQQQKQAARVAREKTLVKMMWPIIEPLKTIYDAQTLLSAFAGFVTYDIEQKTNAVKVSEINIDLSKEKDAKLKDAMEKLAGLMAEESAKDAANLARRFGDTIAQYSAQTFMKQKMSKVKLTDFLAE